MSSPMTVVHRATNTDLAGSGQRPGADRGNPQVALTAVAPDALGSIGIWQCEPGGWPVEDRQDTEVAYILEGRAIITDTATATAHEVTAGDLVVLPVGWTGRWDVVETVRKIYVIY